MQRRLGLIGSVGLGALVLYFVDPMQGRRRQARLRDQMTHLRKEANDALDVASRDFANRAQGLTAATNAAFTARPAADPVLVERVRAKLGRYVSHAHALHVDAQQGAVMLSGPILRREEKRLMRALWTVRGVTSIINRLDVHRQPDIAALQGGRRKTGEHPALMRRYWPPAWRMFVGSTGALLSVYGFSRKGLAGSAAGAIGLGLVARAWTNLTFRQLLGWRGRQGMRLENTIHVNASLEQVFAYWRHPENFPGFMRYVRAVRPVGGGRYRWTVAGPGGTAAQWDTVMTRCVQNRVISWASAPGSQVEQSGSAYFEPADGGVRLHIVMQYKPPAGALGQAVAALFHADAKSEMDEDLMRMKMFLESGRPPHDAARPPRQEQAHPAAPRQQFQPPPQQRRSPAQNPEASARPAVFAGRPASEARNVAVATGAGTAPAAGARTETGGAGRSESDIIIDTGGGVIGRAGPQPLAAGTGLAAALEAGRQAVNEAGAFQGAALLPEQRIRIAQAAIDQLAPYREQDEEAEGLMNALEGAIESNQRLLNDVSRPKT